MQKTRANPSANNGSVSKSVSQTVLRLSFDSFAPGIVRLTRLEQVEQFLATLHRKPVVQTLKTRIQLLPVTFTLKLS